MKNIVYYNIDVGDFLPKYVKDELNVDADEALEMLNSLAQEGMIEIFAYDGTHFKVKK